MDYISGTFDYFGFNHYSTYLASDAREPELNGKPGYEKDMRTKTSGDPSWKKASDGRMVRGFFKLFSYIEKQFFAHTSVLCIVSI